MKLKEFLYTLATPLLLGRDKPLRKGKKVLLVRDDALGDLLLFSGVLNDYLTRCAGEGREVNLLVDKSYQEIAELYLPGRNILVLDKRRYFSDLKYRLDFIRNLRTEYYDLVIGSIHASSVCRDVMKYSCGGRKISRNFADNNMKGHILNDELDFYSRVLGEKAAREQIMPFIPKDKLLTAKRKDYFVLLGESGDQRRNYSREKLLNIAERIGQRYDLECILLGVEAGTENKAGFVDLRGRTSIRQALELISSAKLVIGNETGLTHAGWIMQVPTVMIYGGGHFGRFLPLNKYGEIVMQRMECCQCDWQCCYKAEKFPCITGISEQEILNACEKILNEVLGCENIGDSKYPE